MGWQILEFCHSKCRLSGWQSCELEICVPTMRQVIADGSGTSSSAAAAAGETRYGEQKSSTPIIHVHRLLTEYADSKNGRFPSREHSSLMNYGHSALRQAFHNFDLSFQFPGIATELEMRSQEICDLLGYNAECCGNSASTDRDNF